MVRRARGIVRWQERRLTHLITLATTKHAASIESVYNSIVSQKRAISAPGKRAAISTTIVTDVEPTVKMRTYTAHQPRVETSGLRPIILRPATNRVHIGAL
jgi:hypothetical protein